MTSSICGVDVSSVSLEARLGAEGPSARFANTAEGIAELAEFCRQHQVELVAMEATGGYEKRAFALLWARGVPVAVVNPCAVRRFAEGMGVLEKTDAIDAGVIAWYAEVKQVRPTPLPSPEQMRLQALVTRLRQLTDLQTQQRQQARLVSDEAVLAGYTELLALVAKQIRTLEEAIAERIAADPLWQQLDAAFRTIKGVADRTVARVMAHMPEIGTLSNKAVAKLAGLAPLAKDSGKRHGPRTVRGGRREVRDILYFVAGVVRKYEPDFATFHDRLRQAGKAKKVIRVALAHKLLVRLNAKAREVRRAFPPLSCAVPM